MKLEEAIRECNNIIKKAKQDFRIGLGYKEQIEAIETVLQALENSVSKDKVKEILKDLKFPILIYGGRGNGRTYAKAEKQAKIWILEKLLEDK